MNLIERYVHACIRHLPKKLKSDVSKELTSEIEEMVEEQIHEGFTNEEAIQSVLESLGDPKSLAHRYVDKPMYLIGPAYYSTFITVAKIVFMAVTLGLTVAFIVSMVFSSKVITPLVLLEYLASILSGGIQALAWVILIFVILERADDLSVRNELKHEVDGTWSLKDLPEVPTSKKSMRGEGIAGLIFTLVFFILLNTQIEWFSAFVLVNGTISSGVPMFNLATINEWLLFFNISLLLSSIVYLWYIVKPYRTTTVYFRQLALELVSLFLVVLAFVYYSPLNSELFEILTPNSETLIQLWQSLVSNAGWYIGFFGLLGIALDSISFFKNRVD